jgi:predicted NUDIX family phosphoesterase
VSFDPDQYYPIMYALLRAEHDGKLRQDASHESEDRLHDARPVTVGALE